MVVLITGAGGLLGGAVARALGERGEAVVALAHADLDVTDAGAVTRAVQAAAPDAVVHCAALTNVDRCETEPELARAVNVDGSANVARAAAVAGADVVAVSTDYVFDGTKGEPYVEDDPTNPIQVYGRTKLAGEDAVRDATSRHAIVRSAWIYGPGGKNFLSRLPDLVADGTPITAVTDQIGSPTYAPDLADGIADIVGRRVHGTFHVVDAGACSFAAFCRHALGAMGVDAEVKEITVSELGRPAPRPADTRLEGRAWEAAGFPPLRAWEDAATAFVREVS